VICLEQYRRRRRRQAADVGLVSQASKSRATRALLQSLQHVGTIAAPIKIPEAWGANCGKPHKFDQRLKIEVGPFGHHAVEYFAAVLLPGAVKTGKEVQRVSSVSVPRRRRF
jgi:hypothetical protein